ncbi:hypothetical protein KRR40_25425 [Niabella defluvii]|nr:hypothetical protein KRR40_25425 [Niabella sp. I65]
MKRIIVIISLSILGLLPAFRASAQADEIAQLVLNIEKLAQFKQILSDMKKATKFLAVAIIQSRTYQKATLVYTKHFLTA